MTPNEAPGLGIAEHHEVRRHLETILASRAFRNAPRGQQFLRFVVEETLAGRASDIAEPAVAAQVFNLRAKFDRRNNSIVRAEASHVRRRLRDYYLNAASADSVVIELPRGGYVPVVRIVAGSRPPNAGLGRLAAWMSLFRPRRSGPRE
jgi:hypothetical protein